MIAPVIRLRSCLPNDLDACLGIVRGLPEFFTADALDTIRSDLGRRVWAADDDEVVGFAIARLAMAPSSQQERSGSAGALCKSTGSTRCPAGSQVVHARCTWRRWAQREARGANQYPGRPAQCGRTGRAGRANPAR
jgi:hypothetical protein